MSTQPAVERPDNSGVDQCPVHLAWHTVAAIASAKKAPPTPVLPTKTTYSAAPSSMSLLLPTSNSTTAAIAPNHGGMKHLHLQQQQQHFFRHAQHLQQEQQQQFTLACALAAEHRPSHVVTRTAIFSSNSRSSKPAIAPSASPPVVEPTPTRESKYVREGKWTEEEET